MEVMGEKVNSGVIRLLIVETLEWYKVRNRIAITGNK